MLKRIIASTSLLLYLLLPFFNIQMMNIFYPNFLRNNQIYLLLLVEEIPPKLVNNISNFVLLVPES